MIWQASLVSSVLVALTFGALWLLRKASSDRRRTTCICAILGCIATWLMAFAPSGWLPQLHAPGVAGVSSAIEQRAQPVIERLTSAQPLPVVAAIHREGPPPKVIDWAAVYGVGVAAVLIVWFGGWAFSVRLVAKGQDAEHLQAQPGWRTCVVPSLRVPASLGWPCPSILLPKDALDWNAETLDVVLRHEASHLQRRDHAWIGLANLLCAVQWFNPFAWLLARRLRLECELLADDTVVVAGVKPSAYAEIILQFQGVGSPFPTLSVLQPLYRRSSLSRRLDSILSPVTERSTMNKPLTLGIASFTVVGLIVLSALTLGGWKQDSTGGPPKAPDAPMRGSFATKPYPQYSIQRDVQIVQIGLKVGNSTWVWNPKGVVLPYAQIIDHDWYQNVELASPAGSAATIQLPARHIVFRIKADPSDGKPVVSVFPERSMSHLGLGTEENDFPPEYLTTKDGWYYFVERQYLTAKGPISDPTGVHGLGGTAININATLTKPVDEGPVKRLPLFSDWSATQSANSDSDETKRKNSNVWSKVTFKKPTQIWEQAHFFNKDGKEIPESLVDGEFVDAPSVNHTMKAIYYVGVAPSQIGDVRITTRKSVSVQFDNVPMSPAETPVRR